METEKGHVGSPKPEEHLGKVTIEGQKQAITNQCSNHPSQEEKKSWIFTPLAPAVASVLASVVALGIATFGEMWKEKLRRPELKAEYTVRKGDEPFEPESMQGACTPFFRPERSSFARSGFEHKVEVINLSKMADSINTILRIAVSPPAGIYVIAVPAATSCDKDLDYESRNAANNSVEVRYKRRLYRQEKLELFLGVAYPKDKASELARANISVILFSDNGGEYALPNALPLFTKGIDPGAS